jgi:galactokinase
MPALVASAPGRVNLIGEHTDYNGGLCLPIALPQRTTVTLTPRDDLVLSLSSAQEDATWEGTVEDRPSGWAAYVAGVVAVLRADGYAVPGFRARIDSQVPVGAGLSSSAALECGIAVAVAGLLTLDLDEAGRRRLADVCIRAENEYVGAPTGGMDQTIAMLGRPGFIDTRVSHTLTDGSYGDRRTECSDAAAALGVDSLRDTDLASVERMGDPVLLRRARHVVTENQRVLDAVAAVEAGDWAALSATLDASHVSMRDDFEISCPELDLAVETSRRGGALGARMTGGGFGGSAVALVPAEDADVVQQAVTSAFAGAQMAAPEYLVVTPGDAARVDRLS